MGSAKLDDSLRAAGQLTVAFLCLYGSIFVLILLRKKHLSRKAKANKTKFDRYKSFEMHVVDRLQGNFLEWSPLFLGLTWSLAAVGALCETLTLIAAWMYVAVRFLYIILVLQNGVAQDGLNKALWPSTFPAYACLLFMAFRAIAVLYF